MYKRQGYTLLKSFLAGDVNANRCYAGLSPEEQQLSLIHIVRPRTVSSVIMLTPRPWLTMLMTVGSVSYTHLDVYKRQCPCRA